MRFAKNQIKYCTCFCNKRSSDALRSAQNKNLTYLYYTCLFILLHSGLKVLSLGMCVTFVKALCLSNSLFPLASNQNFPTKPNHYPLSSIRVTNEQIPTHSATQRHSWGAHMWWGNGDQGKRTELFAGKMWGRRVVDGELTSGEMVERVMMDIQ